MIRQLFRGMYHAICAFVRGVLRSRLLLLIRVVDADVVLHSQAGGNTGGLLLLLFRGALCCSRAVLEVKIEPSKQSKCVLLYGSAAICGSGCVASVLCCRLGCDFYWVLAMPRFEWCGHKGPLSARGKCVRCGQQGPKTGGQAWGPVKAASGKVGGKIGGKARGPVKALKGQMGIGVKCVIAEVDPTPRPPPPPRSNSRTNSNSSSSGSSNSNSNKLTSSPARAAAFGPMGWLFVGVAVAGAAAVAAAIAVAPAAAHERGEGTGGGADLCHDTFRTDPFSHL
jgi:hypothetical protein